MKTIDWANLSFGYMPTDYDVQVQLPERKLGRT